MSYLLTVLVTMIVTILFHQIILVFIAWLILITYAAWEWFKTKFFQATAMGGWCLATVAVAFGLCTWEQFGGESKKKDDKNK